MTENKITIVSSDCQLSKNRINSSSSPSPSNSNHGSPWKLGLMRTEWVRKVSRTVINCYWNTAVNIHTICLNIEIHWLLNVPYAVTLNYTTFCPHSVFMCFVWISEQTAIISLYNINWLVCITETESVHCAVRTGSLIRVRFNLNLQVATNAYYAKFLQRCFQAFVLLRC